jgi:hypothetical protein
LAVGVAAGLDIEASSEVLALDEPELSAALDSDTAAFSAVADLKPAVAMAAPRLQEEGLALLEGKRPLFFQQDQFEPFS